MRCFIISAFTDGDNGKSFSQFIFTTKELPTDIIDRFKKSVKDSGRKVVGEVMYTELRKPDIEKIYKTFNTPSEYIDRVEGNVVYVDFKK